MVGFCSFYFFFVALTLHFSQMLGEKRWKKKDQSYCILLFLDGDKIFRIEKLWNHLTAGVDKY